MKLYLPQQVYALDRLSIEQDGQSESQLMLKAARAVWKAIQQRWPDALHMVVFAGPGNNGGDAFAIAQLAQQAGLNVTLFAPGDLNHQSETSRYYRSQWEGAGGETQNWSGSIPPCDLIVDGLLGIGLNKPLDENWQAIIHAMNSHPCRAKICVDIPSGLNASTGNPMPVAVAADVTVSFIGRKLGCYVADGADYCGERIFDDLGLSSAAENQVEAASIVLNPENSYLPARRKINSHKYQFGHVLVIGGDVSMSGAVQLAGLAALRTGAGVVSLCVHEKNETKIGGIFPELMVSNWNKLDDLLPKASVILIGPGLGYSAEASQVMTSVLQHLNLHSEKPVVIDADALQSDWLKRIESVNAVITPHAGEAGRLLNIESQQIQQDRLCALKKLNDKFNMVSVLKGAGTLLSHKNQPVSICTSGHAGMATAGSGDVLAGMIAGYLAQGLASLEAAKTAVYIHAKAAEYYAQKQDADSLIASDIIHNIAKAVRELRQSQETG